MRNRACVVLLAAAACAPARTSLAQGQVELRLVERTGQTLVTPSDHVLDFAMQMRVVSDDPGIGIGGFAFSMIINGESPTRGTLSRDAISNLDGTYFPGIANGTTSFVNGLASQFQYLVGLSPIFNGLINSSGGGWTQTPSQDIGLISGDAAGQPFLMTPGVDANGDGTPDMASGDVAKLPQNIMETYFGANGHWIDVYRFRYNVSNFTARTLDFHLVTTSTDPWPTAFTFGDASLMSGLWGADNVLIDIPPENIQGLEIGVVPSPGAGALIALGIGGAAARRRRNAR